MITKSKKNSISVRIKKYLPHNFLAEKMIISCLLVNPESPEKVLNFLSSEYFYFQNHQIIYEAIRTLYKKKSSVDVLTIATFLQKNGLLKKAGGIKVLLELISQVPDLMYLEEYVKLIKEKFVRRSLIKLGYELICSSYVENLSLENIFSNFEQEFFDLNNELAKSQMISTSQILNYIFGELREKFLNPGLPGIKSGFKNLDLLTQGFQKSDLVILAGRPSMGKTALSLTITLNVIRRSKLPVLFFSLEMSKEQIMYRILSMETNISQLRLKSGQLYQNDWIKLHKLMKVIAKLPLFIDDSPNLSVETIRPKVKNVLQEQQSLGLIIIDYLQLMQDLKNKSNNRVEELSKITRELKSIAREFNVPLISLSQLSRNVENRENQKPILSDLRESGSIEQDADLVLMLSKSSSSPSSFCTTNTIESVDLVIAKHRNGPTGTINLEFNKKQTKFLS